MATIVAFKRSTREVFSIKCPVCQERIEVEPDNQGNGLWLIAAELVEHFKKERHPGKHLPDERNFKRLVKVETVPAEQPRKPIDLSDIISRQQLHRRAKRRAAKTGETIEQAKAQVRQEIEQKVSQNGLFACKCCGKPISEEHYRNGGLGPKCKNGTHRCKVS